MADDVDELIEQAREVAAAVDSRTMFARVYQALIAERQKVLSMQELLEAR